MSNNSHKDLVNPNQADDMVLLWQTLTGMVPVFGGALSATGATLIPNQKIDRVAKFAIALERRVIDLELSARESLSINDFNVDLIEASLIQSTKALTDARIECIAEMLVNDLVEDGFDYYENKRVIDLLGVLTDRELIILAGHDNIRNQGLGRDSGFTDELKSIVRYQPNTTDTNWRVKLDLHESQVKHLVELGLLVEQQDVDHETGKYMHDVRTGRIAVRGTDISKLGCFLLDRIGMTSSRFEVDWFEDLI